MHYGEWRDLTGLGSVLKLTSWWPGCWYNDWCGQHFTTGSSFSSSCKVCTCIPFCAGSSLRSQAVSHSAFLTTYMYVTFELPREVRLSLVCGGGGHNYWNWVVLLVSLLPVYSVLEWNVLFLSEGLVFFNWEVLQALYGCIIMSCHLLKGWYSSTG